MYKVHVRVEDAHVLQTLYAKRLRALAGVYAVDVATAAFGE